MAPYGGPRAYVLVDPYSPNSVSQVSKWKPVFAQSETRGPSSKNVVAIILKINTFYLEVRHFCQKYDGQSSATGPFESESWRMSTSRISA